ncbi:MAG: hypothetical protein ACI81R_002082 [Bradymonadia bacterium]|jgi:hypothetical protein
MSDHNDSDISSEEVEDFGHMSEQLGYRECDVETLDDADIDLHDEVLDYSVEELAKLDETNLSDLVKWAAAQAWADFDDDDKFRRLTLEVVRSATHHAAIDYAELCYELVNDAILEAEWDFAESLLPELGKLAPDDPTVVDRMSAVMLVLKGERDEGLARMQTILESAGDEAGLVLCIGEDLLACGEIDRAKEVIDAAEELARAENDTDILVDIATAREFVLEIEAEEAAKK